MADIAIEITIFKFGKPSISMVHFSYVKLPEGIPMVATWLVLWDQKILLVHCVTDILGHKSYSNFDRSVVPPFFAFSFPVAPFEVLTEAKAKYQSIRKKAAVGHLPFLRVRNGGSKSIKNCV